MDYVTNQLFEQDDEERQVRRARHREEMRRQKQRQLYLRRIRKRYLVIFAGVCLTGIVIFAGVRAVTKSGSSLNEEKELQSPASEVISEVQPVSEEVAEEAVEEKPVFTASADESTTGFSAEVISEYGVLIDVENQKILAGRKADTIMNPASMTKVLTVLVAAENIENLDDTFTINREITDYCYQNDCWPAGFADGETLPLRDLFYGAVLPSGGDAALGLAYYVAGSQEAFVDLMNEKARELGLSDTAHFTNCVGIYDEDHYCTVYDMAVILQTALQDDFLREVLSTHQYTTTATTDHPEGITFSNWFLRRIEDKDSGGTVICGKTGYVVQSGNCAASYAQDSSGKGYICVTGQSTSSLRCIYDHVAIYKEFLD